MEITNTSRYIIEKDAIFYLRKNKIYDKSLDFWICPQNLYDYEYEWDMDFAKYSRFNIQKIEDFKKFYQDLDLLLKNLYLEKIFSSIESVIKDLVSQLIAKKSKEWKKLIILNISPLEWAIVWEFFKKNWLKNTIYNFNRNPLINSFSKTLEAMLYVSSFKNSEYLNKKTQEISEKIWKIDLDFSDFFLLIDENNNNESYFHLNIDSYLKAQIWMKETKNIYRVDKYPTKDFVVSKGISNVLFFDNDNLESKINSYYEDYLKNENTWVVFEKIKYNLSQIKNIWFYEDYLLEQNKEFLLYKSNIWASAIENTKDEIAKNPNPKLPAKNQKSLYENLSNNSGIKDMTIVPYLVLFPILFVAFVVSDLNPGAYYWTTNWTSWVSNWWTNFYYFWGLWWNWWGWGSSYVWGSSSSSSSSYSSSSSKSTIKSFWGGWFSKWSSSS